MAPGNPEGLYARTAAGLEAYGDVEAEKSETSSVSAFQPRQAATTTRAEGSVKVATPGSFMLLEGGRGEVMRAGAMDRGKQRREEQAARREKRQTKCSEKEVDVKRVKKVVTVVDEKEKEIIRDVKNMEEMAEEKDESVAKKKKYIAKEKSQGKNILTASNRNEVQVQKRKMKVEAKVTRREDGVKVVGGSYMTAARASPRLEVTRQRRGVGGGEVEAGPAPRKSPRLPRLPCELCPAKLRDAGQLHLHYSGHFGGRSCR